MNDRVNSLPIEGMVRLDTLTKGPAPILPISRTLIYEKIKKGTFPAPYKIGQVSVWNVAHIRAWIANPQ